MSEGGVDVAAGGTAVGGVLERCAEVVSGDRAVHEEPTVGRSPWLR